MQIIFEIIFDFSRGLFGLPFCNRYCDPFYVSFCDLFLQLLTTLVWLGRATFLLALFGFKWARFGSNDFVTPFLFGGGNFPLFTQMDESLEIFWNIIFLGVPRLCKSKYFKYHTNNICLSRATGANYWFCSIFHIRS